MEIRWQEPSLVSEPREAKKGVADREKDIVTLTELSDSRSQEEAQADTSGRAGTPTPKGPELVRTRRRCPDTMDAPY